MGDVKETSKSTLRSGLHLRKVLLSIYWNLFDIVYFEVPEPNQTIKADSYFR